MRLSPRSILGFAGLLLLFAGACELGMRDKSELSGGGGKDGGVGGKLDGGSCDKTHADCDGVAQNGCETNVAQDPHNCGSCKNVCPSTGNTPTCINGTCGMSNCPAPSLDCDSDPVTCETNGNTSLANCGYCGHACALANANQTCENGQCVLTGCKPGFADCNGIASDGCEASLTSAADCGGCGKSCNVTNGTGACTNLKCAIGSCNAGYGDCDNNLSNGCESTLAGDPKNCGSCGNVCGAGQVCKNGACQATTCTAPMADCDANPDCETNVQTSVDNCGYCGNACSFPNAQATCTNGQCTMGACNSGHGDCDPSVPGCETQLGSSTNCAACGDDCTGPNLLVGYCAITSCVMICNNGYADCSKTAPGCEVAVATDIANCGACGNDCNANKPANTSAACVNGACVYTCNSGFGNCDAAPDCETNLATSASNCGECGRTCPATSCSAGLCAPEVVSGVNSAQALAVDPTTVYVGRSPGGIMKIDRAAWTTASVVDANPNVAALSVNSGYLYFVDPGVGVQREPTSGGTVEVVSPQTGGYDVVAANDGRIYYSFTSGQGFLRSQSNGSNSQVIDSQSPVHGIFADNSVNLIAWTLPSTGEVHTQGMALGNPKTPGTGQASPESVAGDTSSVYWTNNGDGTIMTAPRNGGGSPSVLASGQTGAFAIAITSNDVYWTTDQAAGGVYKIAKSGGPVITLATGASHPQSLVVDGNDVIWAELGSGLVKRVPQ